MSLSSKLLAFFTLFYSLNLWAQEVVDCPPVLQGPNLEVESLQRLMSFQQSCNSMRPGQSHIFKDANKTVGDNGLYANYKLTRSEENPNHYVASFNPIFNFRDDNGSGGSYPVPGNSARDRELTQIMIERTNECLAEVNGSLSGPFGQSLEIRLEKSSMSSNPPPPIQITVANYYIEEREHVGLWSRYSSCPTIVHEIFHYLGLADSYHEQEMGYYFDQEGYISNTETSDHRAMFDCRSISPQDSIMHDHELAVSQLQDVDLSSLYEENLSQRVIDSNFNVDAIGELASTVRMRLSDTSLNSIPGKINDFRSFGQFQRLNSEAQTRLNQIEAEIAELRNRYNNSPLRPTGAEAQRYGDPQWLQMQRDRFEFMTDLESKIAPLYEDFRRVMVANGLEQEIKSSLLYPAEFLTVISRGPCYLTHTYEQCSRNAYAHTFAPAIPNVPNYQLCAYNVPEVCGKRGDPAWLQLD